MSNVIPPPTQIPNQFLPLPYFPIPFPPPPVAPSNVSAASSAPASDLSAAISLMTNAVNQGNSNTTAIMDALQRTTTEFVDTLQQTIQMGVGAQAEEIKNTRLDKQFDKIKIFDGSDPSACHPRLEEVHALCTQTGRSFREMLLLCAGQAVHAFITDMSPDATDDQIKNDLITGYSDLQGLGCKQAAYDNITQKPDEPLKSYIVRYSRLFKLLNGTAPNDVRMRMTSMYFVNSLRSYLSSKVENRPLGMNERNYSLGDTLKVALECELKAIASERQNNKRNAAMTNQVEVIQPQTPKQSLCVQPILKYTDTSKGYMLYTDASKYGWAGVLTQAHTSMVEGKKVTTDHPVAYVSGLFRGSQLNWAALTKEAFAIYMSVKKLSFYLTDADILLKSDHLPLKKFLQKNTLNNKVNNWAMELEAFNIRFKHVSGKANILADTLSCLVDIDPDARLDPENARWEFGYYEFESLPKLSSEDIIQICEILSGENIIRPDPDIQQPFIQQLRSPLMLDQLCALQAQDDKCTKLTQMLENGKLDPVAYSLQEGILYR